MENQVMELNKINPELQKMVESKTDVMPLTLAKVLSPLELEHLMVIHPSDNDPVLISSKYGAIAIWFQF